MEANQLSVILPVLNDAEALEATLRTWVSRRGKDLTVVSVDGGSDDKSDEIAREFSDICCSAPAGRARQMNVGADHANSAYYLFLHADTHVSEEAYRSLLWHLSSGKLNWGFFPVCLDNKRPVFRVIETMMNWRSKFTRVATGDQCLIVSREFFERVDGFDEIPLMEDVEITKQLRQLSEPVILDSPVLTSTRRWQKHGIARTILLMWLLRCAYFLGVSPVYLHRLYY